MSLATIKRAYRKTCDTLYPRGIAFHHVPKCGGSSISRAFRLRFFLSQVKIEESAAHFAGRYLSEVIRATDDPKATLDEDAEQQIHLFKRAMYAYLLSENVKFVQAHVHFDRRLYDSYRHTHRFITLLRDPVERYVSQYYYDYGRRNRNCIHEPMEEFVDTPRGIETGRVFLDYFGETHIAGMSDAQCVDRAKANLELFTVVGFLDEIEIFRQQVANSLGVRLRIGHVNKGSNQRKTVNDEVYQRIRTRCAEDMEIYEHARRLLIPAENNERLMLQKN